ncbi:hypothetical protein [Ruminococcus sp.]|uniref:hypothetical protein n=1 Tax=Ruminococcus sp. TaxID=41978 RepID=UPI0025F7F839|nr:hypothetical protein [Ruminococcus sp.]
MEKRSITLRKNNFTLYDNKNGVKWWQCDNCKYLTRGVPEVCPLCHGCCSNTETAETKTENAFDKIFQQLEDLIAKYQDE